MLDITIPRSALTRQHRFFTKESVAKSLAARHYAPLPTESFGCIMDCIVLYGTYDGNRERMIKLDGSVYRDFGELAPTVDPTSGDCDIFGPFDAGDEAGAIAACADRGINVIIDEEK